MNDLFLLFLILSIFLANLGFVLSCQYLMEA